MSGERRAVSGAGPASTLVIQTAFLGDVVLTTGLLVRLSGRDGPVDVVTTKAAAPLLRRDPAVARVIVYDKRGEDRGIGGLLRLARSLRSAHYARVYLPHRSHRSAALAWLARIPRRIGFAGSPGAWGYTERIPRRADRHEAERLLDLAGPVDGPAACVTLGLSAEDHAEAARWLESRGVEGEFIAIAPGAIWGTKRWPGYGELITALARPVVIVGGPDDQELGESLRQRAPARVHNAAGALSITASAALIARAALLVTNDSAPLHLASAVGTRSVAIFGPTVPAFGFGPRGPHDRIVELAGLPCRPCSHHGPMVCPLGHHRCMRDLGVDKVLEAVSGKR